MDREQVWDLIVQERLALLEHLRELDRAEWDHPSLCDGWRVRDVAAHVIAAPQLTWGPTLRALTGVWRGYNRMTLLDGQRRGSVPVETILEQYERWADVRRGPAIVTYLEPLVDVLVHTQDILRPLGRSHEPPPDAAAVAADRARHLAMLLGSAALVRTVRMRATDVDWERGRRGPLVSGPMLELLMLCAGRSARTELLHGEGVATPTA